MAQAKEGKEPAGSGTPHTKLLYFAHQQGQLVVPRYSALVIDTNATDGQGRKLSTAAMTMWIHIAEEAIDAPLRLRNMNLRSAGSKASFDFANIGTGMKLLHLNSLVVDLPESHDMYTSAVSKVLEEKYSKLVIPRDEYRADVQQQAVTRFPGFGLVYNTPPMASFTKRAALGESRTEDFSSQCTRHICNHPLEDFCFVDLDPNSAFEPSSRFDVEFAENVLLASEWGVVLVMAGPKVLEALGILKQGQSIHEVCGARIMNVFGRTFIVVVGYQVGFSNYRENKHSKSLSAYSFLLAFKYFKLLCDWLPQEEFV